jgi:rhamnosyltransferase
MFEHDKTLLVCPTYNPGKDFREWVAAYQRQICKPNKVVIIDSSSDDGFIDQLPDEGFDIRTISKSKFNHGGTRQIAVNLNQDYSYVVYLTQDAILASENALEAILRYFEDEEVAAVCGRQIPRKEAGPIGAHLRLFNYGTESRVTQFKENMGLKSILLSNSFSAYRIKALQKIGGFPNNVIFGEDMYVSAKLLKAGYRVAYAADACVYHSHDYSLLQELRRYFDMGVFHAREPWIRQEFGGAEKEGVSFVVSEVKYLGRHAFWKIPEGLLRTVFKYVGFRLGLAGRYIPLNIKRKISMNPGYFKTE